MADIDQLKKEIAALKETKELLTQKVKPDEGAEQHLKAFCAQFEEDLNNEQKYYEKQIRILELLARDDLVEIANLTDKIDTLGKILAEERKAFFSFISFHAD